MNNTSLFQCHKALDAKLVPFAGYQMPLYYDLGIIKEHMWVRNSCGIFDVSHMGQLFITGNYVSKLLSIITPSDFSKQKQFYSKYTTLLSSKCTIIDDLIATKIDDNKFFLVINASRKVEDLNLINSFLTSYNCKIDVLDKSLIAIQGPKAETVLSSILDISLKKLQYMQLQTASYLNEEIFISRTGYTGEDGFEISISNDNAPSLWKKLIDNKAVKPIGLGARDTLRLEMGYPLYGHDLTENINLGESSLKWIITSNENYSGKKHYNSIPKRKRVGIKLLDKGIAREGMEIYNMDNGKIGILTSSGYSPTLQLSIGQGYVDSKDAIIGNKVLINIRGKQKEAEITKMSFLPPKTKK